MLSQTAADMETSCLNCNSVRYVNGEVYNIVMQEMIKHLMLVTLQCSWGQLGGWHHVGMMNGNSGQAGFEGTVSLSFFLESQVLEMSTCPRSCFTAIIDRTHETFCNTLKKTILSVLQS
jgi:hypothetical protein